MISRHFIDRPVLASVIAILTVVLGAIAAFRLPVDQYPELAPPVVRVEASYPGANAQTVADTVAAPIEQEVNGVEKMLYMQSNSADGRYSLDISFEPGTDVDMAAVLVQNRVNAATSRLPEEVRRQGVTTRKQSTAFVGVVALSSTDGRYDDVFLSNYLSLNFRDQVLRLDGIGGVNVIPAKDYAMRVWLDPGKLRARGLVAQDVVAAIRAQNIQVAAGAIGREPAPAGTDVELIVTTKGRLERAEEFGEIIVKRGADRSIVRVRDLGRVELGSRDYSTYASFNGNPGAILIAYQLPGANLTEVAGRVDQAVKDFQEQLPEGLQANFFYDASMFITASLRAVGQTLVEAFVLVFVVVLVFLRSWRATLIPTLTIPVSLVGTFLVMQMLGFSINMLTMFAMILAIGIVVDDAIIVVENVERNMTQRGLGARQATVVAMEEITGPVIAITLVLMSVFVPASALPGITGTMYRQFALTIAASTFLSAVSALTLSPALCALLLTHHGHGDGHGAATPWPLRPFSWISALFERLFDAITAGYVAFTRVAVRWLLPGAAAFALIMWGTADLSRRVPRGFVPNEDLGFMVMAVQLPDGAALARTKAVIDVASARVGEVPGVQNVIALTGFSMADGQGAHLGTCFINLQPWDVRTGSGRSVDVIMQDIKDRLSDVQEATFQVFSLPAVRGLGNTQGFDMRLLDRGGVGREAMQQTVDDLVAAARGQSRLASAYSSYRQGVPQLYLDVDREKAAKLGVDLPDLFGTLQASLGAAYVNDLNLFGRTYQVNVQAAAEHRQRADDIGRLEVRNRAGQMVPLGALVQVRDTTGPDRVARYNMYPVAQVIGTPAPGVSSGEALELMDDLAADRLPPGVDYAWSSMSFQERLAGNQGALALGLAMLIIYLLLAGLYESWTSPLAVMLSVPLVIAGAMIALQLRGLDNNVFTQIGLVLLVGLGAKNAILIVEFALAAVAQGKTAAEAAVEAAKLRFRPIVMTSFAFILGVAPLLWATGAGAASRRSLGTAVFGGMLGGTLLGLVATPVLFVIVQRLFGGRPREEAGAAEEPSPPAA